MAKQKILVFGNPYLKDDALAVRIAGRLDNEGFEIIRCERPDDLLNHELDKSIILDVASGIDEITVFDDPDSLEFSAMFSLHDFDLGFFIKLLKEAGRLDRIRIIGVPQEHDEEKAVDELKRILKKI